MGCLSLSIANYYHHMYDLKREILLQVQGTKEIKIHCMLNTLYITAAFVITSLRYNSFEITFVITSKVLELNS